VWNCSGCKEPIQLLDDELSLQQSVTAAGKPQTTSSSSSSSSGHWMLRYPSQSVLTVDAVLWERSVHSAIEKQDKLELKALW